MDIRVLLLIWGDGEILLKSIIQNVLHYNQVVIKEKVKIQLE